MSRLERRLPRHLAACLAFSLVTPPLVACPGPPEVEMGSSSAGEEAAGGAASFDHSPFDRLLAAHVDAEGLIDYRGLRGESAALDAYLESLADAHLETLGRDAKLALLINAYNAFTLRLILDHYPLDSIRDVPSDERWEGRTWELAGRRLTLDQIEHEEIRPHFREPRIHFAVNCASIGCPPLRREAYVAERLDAQLEDQTRRVHDRELWLRWDGEGRVAHLTRLYDWYGADFRQAAGSVLAFAARYSEPLAAALEAGDEPEVEWIDYDWRLNGQGAARAGDNGSP